MPEWLLNEDKYVYRKDKDAFIRHSIIAILSVLSRIKMQTEYEYSKFRISPLIKFSSVLIIIFLNSLTRSFIFILIISAALFIILNFLKVDKIKYVIKSAMIVTIFTFVMLLPSAFVGYSKNIIIITLKVLNSVIIANIFACTTKWDHFISSLKLFHVPDIFIFILDTTLKYINVLGEYSLDMFYAIKLKSVGYSGNKKASIFGVIGTTAIKSKEIALEMNDAMECRGFTGKYKVNYNSKLGFVDYIYIILDIIIIFTYLYFERM